VKTICIAALVAAATLGLFAAAPTAEAGNCGYNSYSYGYSQSYSYQPYQAYSYTPVQYKYVDREVLYPYPVKAVVSPDFYFSSQDAYQKQAQAQQNSLVADAAAYRALAILANMQGGSRVQAGASVPAPYDPRTAPVPQQPQGVRPNQPNQQPRQGAVADPSVPAGLAEVVENSCIKCHQGDPKRLDLSDLSRVAKVDRFDCWRQCFDGDMPKGGKPLSDQQTALFKQWAVAARK
jgi:hypothetical protein